MEQTPTYRPWESRWSPANCAAREAQRIAASDRTHQRRAEREALQAVAREAVRSLPGLASARAAAQDCAQRMALAMSAPRRVQAVPMPPR